MREYRDKNKELTSPIIEMDISKSLKLGREVNYLELPIYNSKFIALFEPNSIPIPKITKIILGYTYDYRVEEMKNHLMKIIKLNLGYDIVIEQSRLTATYNEKVT